MGICGGMLGIGGSVIMIPALTFAFGENQHLYQASAMICNFFVAASSLLAHHRAQALVPAVLKRFVPAAVITVIAGVALSNSALFAREKSYLLARIFGVFLLYVAAYNTWRFFSKTQFTMHGFAQSLHPRIGLISTCIGAVTGFCAGLLGMGAGSVSTPLQ